MLHFISEQLIFSKCTFLSWLEISRDVNRQVVVRQFINGNKNEKIPLLKANLIYSILQWCSHSNQLYTHSKIPKIEFRIINTFITC